MRAILGFLAFVIMTAPAFAAEMGDDGLYKPDWFSRANGALSLRQPWFFCPKM
jgi:hypothetical protein